MVAKFCSLEWKKGEVEFIERKPKEKKPSSLAKFVKQKEDGTMLYMIPVKTQYILTVKTEDGQLYTEDVYDIIKYYKADVRITKNFRTKFESFMSAQEYSVDERGIITGIYKSVEKYFYG